MFYVYILYSEFLDRFYIGMSHDPKERLTKHLQKHAGFTSRAKDWKIVYTEAFPTKEHASERERQIKKWKSKPMIRKLIGS
ncbi:MAG: GIY-YIG nuclease family protein [Bacteroidetes bacterium]|nr:GIY-YIG nuclease family protein [Bacteroidota bacterium]